MMLTDTKLQNLKPQDKLCRVNDRAGLYAAVTPAGVISFRYNYSIHGRQETITFGRYGLGGITLAEAREQLGEAKKMIAAGKSPAKEKACDKARVKDADTFAAWAQKWLRGYQMANTVLKMIVKLKPIALAILYVFLFSNSAISQSVDPAAYNGANGGSTFTSGSTVILFGASSYGRAADITGFNTLEDGSNGATVSNKNVLVRDAAITGGPGSNGTEYNNGISDISGGIGGHGGASVFGGISVGGSGGHTGGSGAWYSVNGASGGDASGNTVTLSIINLNANMANGGKGGSSRAASGAAGGRGGGSVYGGLSIGGNGGTITNAVSSSSNSGAGGNSSDNTVTLINSNAKGGIGGNGGNGGLSLQGSGGSGGSGGNGGASVFGGFSIGGSGGYSNSKTSNPFGAGGGNVSGNTVTLNAVTLDGSLAKGGVGGASAGAAGGAGGYGGAMVFGGLSIGGSGGFSLSSSTVVVNNTNGGAAGAASHNVISIANGSSLKGGAGGLGGDGYTTGGAGGHGGASVVGGLSVAGNAGNSGSGSGLINASSIISADGGSSAGASNNVISLDAVELQGGLAGSGGQSANGPQGFNGLVGGSVYGGVSYGGSGGYAKAANSTATISANGGNAGDTSNNNITIAGKSSISGDIYGSYSQGGALGFTNVNGIKSSGSFGTGGQANNNTVTLIGDQITFNGDIYGGRSINGDAMDNPDPTFTSFYQGNTFNITGYSGSAKGIYNFENYNWTLPYGVANQDTVIEITGSNTVELDNTNHTVAMYNDGKQFNRGDQILMIKNNVGGKALLTTPSVRQGLFLVYDVRLNTVADDLVLSILGKENTDPNQPVPPSSQPAGYLHPSSKAYLQGRTSAITTLNQGTDLVSDYLANIPSNACRVNTFGIFNGGSVRSDTGTRDSNIKVEDFSIAMGGTKCFETTQKSSVLLGAFIQHGNSRFNSYDSFGGLGDVHAWGKVQYTGVGLVFHMNVAGSGVNTSSDSIVNKDGAYLNASLSAGQAKTRFDSDMVDIAGVRGQYESKSRYVTAVAGAGYAWKLDNKQLIDLYGRYSLTHLNPDSISMGLDRLNLGRMQSSRVRIGARYSYEVQANVMHYAGLGYEHELKGNASGTAYNMAIEEPSLKGGTGIVEVGVNIKPSATNPAWTVNFGMQGYFDQRKGVSGGFKVRYVF